MVFEAPDAASAGDGCLSGDCAVDVCAGCVLGAEAGLVSGVETLACFGVGVPVVALDWGASDFGDEEAVLFAFAEL